MLNNNEFYRLTTPQKSIYITEQYYKNTNINNVSGYLHICENANIDKLEQAINKFIEKNEQIRARFIKDDKQILKQYYENYRKEKIKIVRLKNIDEKRVFEKEFCNNNFNIIGEKLYRFCIYQLDNGEGGIICSAHHLVCDAWSMTLLINSIIDTYTEKTNDNLENYQYKTYIADEENYYKSDRFKQDIEYWKTIFSDNIDSKNKNLQEEDILAKRIETTINTNLVKKLSDIDKSFFNIYISALSIYFSKINNLKNIIIGTPILNRKNYVEKQMIGMFVNTLPLKFDVNRKTSFNEFIRYNKINEMQMFKHQKMPYDRIMKIAKENNPQLNSLFDITVSYQNARDNHKESTIDYNTGWVFNGCISDSLDVHITDLDNTGNYNIIYDYQVNKFNEDEILKIHNRIINILKQVSNNPNILIKDIDIVTDEEFKEINKMNNNVIKVPENSTIISEFEEQVRKNPNNIAISFEGKEITYSELDIQSNKVANALLKKKIKKADIVAILLPRSLEFFIDMLGILKVGGTYLPLDVEFPNSRINYILNDSKTSLCITDEDGVTRIDEEVNILTHKEIDKTVSQELQKDINENDNCYIIYTSGTTRKSKRCSSNS